MSRTKPSKKSTKTAQRPLTGIDAASDPILRESTALAALVGERTGLAQQMTPVEQLVPNRFNPRQNYAPEALDGLVKSIEEQGFIGALDGRPLADGRIELAYGSRRLLAARRAQVVQIPVFVHPDWDDNRMLTIALVENIQREDLGPNDEAAVVGQMHQRLQWSLRDIARRTGKSLTWVQDRLALYEGPEDVKQMVAARSDASRHARFIAKLTREEARRALEREVIERNMTAEEVGNAVQLMAKGKTVAEAIAIARGDSPSLIKVNITPANSEGEPHESGKAARYREGESRFLTRALQSLARFDPDHITAREKNEAQDLLEQIAKRSTFLKRQLADSKRSRKKKP